MSIERLERKRMLAEGWEPVPYDSELVSILRELQAQMRLMCADTVDHRGNVIVQYWTSSQDLAAARTVKNSKPKPEPRTFPGGVQSGRWPGYINHEFKYVPYTRRVKI